MNHLLRFSFVCSLGPMALGVTVFLLWLQFRWEWLQAVGAYVILGGVALFLVGLTCWMMSADESVGRSDRPTRKLRLKSALALFLLLVNFPLALGIIVVVNNIQSRYYVTIVNESSMPMVQTMISGGGVNVELATIDPGQSIVTYFHIQGTGALTCAFLFEGVQRKCVIQGYVGNGMGGDMRASLRPKGEFEVVNVRYQELVEKHDLKVAN